MYRQRSIIIWKKTEQRSNDGTVEEGDSVTINFTGTIDGKEFDGGSAEDYELVVGDGENDRWIRGWHRRHEIR